MNQSQIEKLKNEMISRRNDESVPFGTLRRNNEEMSHFLTSLRAGEFRSSSALRVAYVPGGTQRSSRLEYNLNSLRSTDSGLDHTLLGKG